MPTLTTTPRGRPAKHRGKDPTRVKTIRLTPVAWRLLERILKLSGLTMADWVEDRIRSTARRLKLKG